VLLGLDDTIERRRGKRIGAKGIYRDPVRSSKGHFVKASGLRWLSLMLLVPDPLGGRVWALPFLTALAPSERYGREHGRRHRSDSLEAQLRSVAALVPEFGGRLAAPMEHNLPKVGVEGSDPSPAPAFLKLAVFWPLDVRSQGVVGRV
jgi:hypothetical protein